MENKPLLSVDEYRAAIGFSIGRNKLFQALHKKVEDGGIKHMRSGKNFKILASEVTDWPTRQAEFADRKKLEGEIS